MPRGHKYIEKINTPNGPRYFYNQSEIDAYKNANKAVNGMIKSNDKRIKYIIKNSKQLSRNLSAPEKDNIHGKPVYYHKQPNKKGKVTKSRYGTYKSDDGNHELKISKDKRAIGEHFRISSPGGNYSYTHNRIGKIERGATRPQKLIKKGKKKIDKIIKKFNKNKTTKNNTTKNKVVKDKIVKDKVVKDKIVKDKIVKDKVEKNW